MLGTIVNCLAIVGGTLLGLLLKNGVQDKYKEIIMQAIGISIVYVGLASALSALIKDKPHPLLFIIALVLGAIIGEFLKIEQHLEQIGKLLESKMRNSSNIAQGFVTASLIYCVGAMAILGSIKSGLTGDHTTLFIKSILDGVLSLLLATSFGIGVAYSAISVLLYQGCITLFAASLQSFITHDMIREISIVGGILISLIGTNLLSITKIKVGNMLPAVTIPVFYYLVSDLLF